MVFEVYARPLRSSLREFSMSSVAHRKKQGCVFTPNTPTGTIGGNGSSGSIRPVGGMRSGDVSSLHVGW